MSETIFLRKTPANYSSTSLCCSDPLSNLLPARIALRDLCGANITSGLEADQRTLAVHGCYAMTATTALTAQNTQGVEDVHITPPAFLGKQIRKVMEDGFTEGEPGIVKIGTYQSFI